ncbi:hypothetical protein D0Z07_3843 [Hyphodiscus hymeniophilus]|uniref:Glycosyltransferase family 31 protein n=1 Tax=Hyphodiscus hymeniophilus TaxID=353542 RepID=A0A9P6VKR1_9HELO|nr:hypothetical protein D0Z07_3843 [Hyphodiscus hymeniophilus]
MGHPANHASAWPRRRATSFSSLANFLNPHLNFYIPPCRPRSLMAPRKPLLLALSLTLLTALLFFARSGFHKGHILKDVNGLPHPEVAKPEEPEPKPCTEHLGWLEPYQFTYPIQYVSRDIIASARADGQRPSLTKMEKPLFGGYTTVDLAESQTIKFKKCLPPLELAVPHNKVQVVDASNMIFGLQTTMVRLKDTVKHLARWLPHTGARLYAIVIENADLAADDAEMAALEKQLQDLGIDAHVIHPVRAIDSFAQRYFSLASVLYGAKDDNTQWITLIDDDTFFPSMFDLQNMLKEHDWTKPQYIGSLSEDWWAVNHYGLMGFGGAGIFLSLPMGKIIDDHMDECKEHLRTTAGDISIMDCVYQFSSTKLTHIPSLHQVDMHGDLSGFYESGREMLSLHHWKEGSQGGYKLEMEKMHLVADICDSCFLQRWQFPNELLLSNGFSITSYPQGHLSGQKPGGVLGTGIQMGKPTEVVNLEETEHTWGDDINVLHSLAPVRNKMDEATKVGYKLLDSMIVNSEEAGVPSEKVVRQLYFKEGGDGEKDTVMVLNWRSGSEAVMAPEVVTPPDGQVVHGIPTPEKNVER